MYGVVLHAHPVRGASHNQRNRRGCNNIFNSLVGVLNRMGIYWSRAVGIATDSEPSMIAIKAGVATNVT